MLISVIVPIYNVEQYLERCLKSIQNQSFTDYEVILVDDGATDHSGKIADDFVKEHERFSVIHKENGGLSDARNAGLSKAKGEYVCFIDSDDMVHPDYLKCLYELCQSYHCAIAQCGFLQFCEERDIICKQENAEITQYSAVEMMGQLYSEKAIGTAVAWNKLFKKTVFDQIQFPKGMLHEDEAVCVELFDAAKEIVCTTEKLYYYYKNQNGIMNQTYRYQRLDILKAYERRMQFYTSHGLYELYCRDSYKYLYKILLNLCEIKDLKEPDHSVVSNLKKSYWKKYRESQSFPWTVKRKLMMFFFGVFPNQYRTFYLWRNRKGNK